MAEREITPRATLPATMLKRAESWQQDEKLYHARDMYFRVVENFPDSDEARQAEERLFTMAQKLEVEGKVYQAMSIYDRLATPPPALTAGRPLPSPMGRPLGRPLLGKVLGSIL